MNTPTKCKKGLRAPKKGLKKDINTILYGKLWHPLNTEGIRGYVLEPWPEVKTEAYHLDPWPEIQDLQP